jgi:hypothetical protein
LQTNIVLSKYTTNTYVKYKIEVYNSTDEKYCFCEANYDGLYTNNNIGFELEGIQEGDFVMAPDGEKVQVAAVREWDPEDVYEITLDDGSSYRCGINHIHNVSYRKDKNSEPIWENVDTKFILNHPDYNFQFRVAD